MPDLVEVAVHRAARPHDAHVDARDGQLAREGLAGGAQAVELGVDHQHRRKPREVMAAREGVAVRIVTAVAQVVAVDGVSRFGREDPGRGDVREEPGELLVRREDAVMQ